MRGSSLICGPCSRAVGTRSLNHSIRLWSLLSPHSRVQHLVQTVPRLSRFQSTLPEKGTQSSQIPTGDSLRSFASLEEHIQKALHSAKSSPTESDVLLALQVCKSYAGFRLQDSAQSPSARTPTSVLLSLDECQPVQPVNHSPPLRGASDQQTVRSTASTTGSGAIIFSKSSPPKSFQPLTDLAYKIISHPDVFITPSILASYVSLQALIRDPSPIPAVFSLYANKSYTPPGSSKPRQPNPNQIKYAIPSHIASAALDAAIESRDMSICLDIIDTSYGAPAFMRAKLIRRAAPAAVAGCLAPLAIYALADTMAGYQDEVDHSLALKYAFSGLLAYVGFTGSIGMVALMTSNDQMVRVTWIVGTPLRYRWLREEEREALDKVSQAWGFSEPNKWGFEEGDEWELLRAVVNRKGMYLDNPALMEGME
ncbi:hypothetical protein DFP73DRAFT_535145 [Morchella snyderi]|nr:hypothetical protein DFP73DRAFT_535145 [Morchella snyderi]